MTRKTPEEEKLTKKETTANERFIVLDNSESTCETGSHANCTKKAVTKKTAAHFICKVGILSALSFVLYLIRFPMPFIFPSFLDFQISDMPALLAGFSMGPVAGSLVIIIKIALKLIFDPTKTGFIGELADLTVGLAFVITASLIYRFIRNKKGAILSLVFGSVAAIVMAIVMNRVALIPFYADVYGFDALVGMTKSLFPTITQESFYSYYLWLSVLPFNFLRCLVSSLITFLVYKRLAKALKW